MAEHKETQLKPDYYEFDQATKRGDVYTKQDSALVNAPSYATEDQYIANLTTGGSQDHKNRWRPAPMQKDRKVREEYDPREGGRIVKRVHLRFDDADTDNTGEANYDGGGRQIGHYGGADDWAGEGRREPGHYLWYTPVLNDSLIQVKVRYGTYWYTSPWNIFTWKMVVDGREFAKGRCQERSSSHTHFWEGYTNSWGSGKPALIEYLMNSDNTSYYTGIHDPRSTWSYREIIVTEYENMNPYGDPIVRWEPDNLNF